MKKEIIEKNHTIFISSNKTEISGISGVLSFTEDEVVLSLPSRSLYLQGEKLCVDSIDTEEGLAVVSGVITSIRYKKQGEKLGFFKKLTK